MFLRSVNKKCAFPFKEPPPCAQRREEKEVCGTAAEEGREKKNPTADGFKSPQQKLCLICGQCWRCKKKREREREGGRGEEGEGGEEEGGEEGGGEGGEEKTLKG